MKKIVFIFPVLGALTLFIGIYSGLIRMGAPFPATFLAQKHGVFMVCGALGTLISLERAVHRGKDWAYLIPALTALILPISIHISDKFAIILAWLNSISLLVLALQDMQKASYNKPSFNLMALGCLFYFFGNSALLFLQQYEIVSYCWIGFFFVYITGERIEFSTIMFLEKKNIRELYIYVLIFTIALMIPSTFYKKIGIGISILLAAIWLIRNDTAINLSKKGVEKFHGLLLLGAFICLIIGGILFVIDAFDKIPFGYDATLHIVFVGFVFSMIFAHLPIILPWVLQWKNITLYHPILYVPPFLLYMSLLGRVYGDIIGNNTARLHSGYLNAFAIILFLLFIAILALSKRKNIQLP